jgi:hypothetical protein
VVEQVEELGAELQPRAFGHLEVLVNAHVPVE